MTKSAKNVSRNDGSARSAGTTTAVPTAWAGVDWAAIDWARVDWVRASAQLATGSPGAWGDLPTRGARRRTPAAGDVGGAEDHGTEAFETDWSTWQAPARAYPVTVYGIHEATPGPRWKALFDATWPAYRSWYLTGPGTRPSLEEARGRLEEHMPELVPTWRELVAQTGGDGDAARFLTMWNLPAFAPACSQLATVGEETSLTRNYDYVPELWEATVYSSEFTGRKVIGTGDCLWGLLDGMNDAGLAVSLTFGGRPGSGPGFAIPLVVRYLLEVAETAAQARKLLRGLPVSMSYNVTVVDVSGERFTAFVAPGQDTEFFDACTATNHRGKTPEYPQKAAQFHSVERLEFLDASAEQGVSAAEARDSFLRDPLHQDHYSAGFGTLFTAHYRPDLGTVEYVWPGVSWTRGFDDPDDTLELVLEGR